MKEVIVYQCEHHERQHVTFTTTPGDLKIVAKFRVKAKTEKHWPFWLTQFYNKTTVRNF